MEDSNAVEEISLPNRLIELGSLRIHLRPDEDREAALRPLVRLLSNQEVADLLGISERTVRRWKAEGRLPVRTGGRLHLADLLLMLSEGVLPTPAVGNPRVPKK